MASVLQWFLSYGGWCFVLGETRDYVAEEFGVRRNDVAAFQMGLTAVRVTDKPARLLNQEGPGGYIPGL